MRYLLDTSVYSQPLRRKAVVYALKRWQEVGDAACAVSIVSIGEVEWGLHSEGREQRWMKYQNLLKSRLEVLQTSNDVWTTFARIKARKQKLGEVVADLDLLIASVAINHGLIVATLNSRDFSRVEGLAWEYWSE